MRRIRNGECLSIKYLVLISLIVLATTINCRVIKRDTETQSIDQSHGTMVHVPSEQVTVKIKSTIEDAANNVTLSSAEKAKVQTTTIINANKSSQQNENNTELEPTTISSGSEGGSAQIITNKVVETQTGTSVPTTPENIEFTTTGKSSKSPTSDVDKKTVAIQNSTNTLLIPPDKSVKFMNETAKVNDFEGANTQPLEGTTEKHTFDINRHTNVALHPATLPTKTQNFTENPVLSFSETHDEKHFNDIILTTPASFRKIPEINENSKVPHLTNEGDTPEISTFKTFNESIIEINRVKSNSTTEKNPTPVIHENEIERTNYDIATNEIKNSTIKVQPTASSGEKRAKYIKENDTNLTLPNAAEVWALASLKDMQHTKESEEQLLNVTSENTISDKNDTSATKQLVDWSEIMKNVDLSNNSFTSSSNSIENTLETSQPKINGKHDAQLEQENQVISLTVSPLTTVPISNDDHYSKNTTPALDLEVELVKTTPSIEKNKVDDLDGIGGKSKIDLNKSEKQIEATSSPIQDSIIGTKANNELLNTENNNMTTIAQNFIDNSNNSSLISTVEPSSATVVTDKFIENTSLQFDITTIPFDSTSSTLSSNYSITDQNQEYESTTTTLESELYPNTQSTEVQMNSTDPREITELPHSTADTIDYSQPSSTLSTELTSSIQMSTETERTERIRSTTEQWYSEAVSLPTDVQSNESSIESNIIDRLVGSTTETVKEGKEISNIPTVTTSSTTVSNDNSFNNSIEQSTVPQSISTKHEVEYSIHLIDSNEGKKQIEVSTVPWEQISTTHDPQLGVTESVGNTPPEDTDYNVIIAISVSVVGIVALILLVGFLYVMRKRQKQLTYGQRCRPVSLDAYSLDNVSVYNSVRRKNALRASKKSYGNAAFDDPSLKHNVLTPQAIGKFIESKTAIFEEFKDVPQVIARADEVPPGCEDKNRYANVVPLPETRVVLQQQNGDEKSEYINANFVQGPKDSPNYYIACQAPVEGTISDFWRMIWEQNSRVIIMATDLIENGIEKCAEYLPASMTLDNHIVYGDYQITLKNREVKEKYAVSTVHVKNMQTQSWREITHLWYKWPENGVPTDEAAVIAMLLEARSFLKVIATEQNGDAGKPIGNVHESNGSLDKTKPNSKTHQGPLTVHCSPGTGRTGTIIACDIALRCLETPKRSIDIPQIVYYVRRGRASAVQTKDQYEFIYRVAHVYATKITGPFSDN